jgi:galactose mutarotase-like enzyme
MLIHKIVNGHPSIFLENECLRVGVLPEKGADIFEITLKGNERLEDIQFLMQTPWGLKAPQHQLPVDFLENYEGGWQELFPNANDGCRVRGQDIPFHGEVALLAWQVNLSPIDPGETALTLSVICQKTPFRLERIMRLRDNERRLLIQEKVTNITDEPCEFVWGHHITLGGNFLESGCIVDIPAQRIYTPNVHFEPLTARLEARQSENWPFARGRNGEAIDLRIIPGPEIHSHDDAVLDGLTKGVYCVTNPRLNLSFKLEWDKDIFPWVMDWQPFGGADLPPLTGIYGIGLEPWVSRYHLADAIKAEQAKVLQGGQTLETELIVEILHNFG